jgi:hypothetical protein
MLTLHPPSNRERLTSMLAILLLSLSCVDAGHPVNVVLNNGRVSFAATAATARDILRAWACAGNVDIVNIDKVSGPELTLSLDDVPEEQALDMLLRANGGYLARRRANASSSVGSSQFDRIVVLQATAPANQIATSPAPATPTGPSVSQDDASFVVRRVIGPDGTPVPDDQEDAPPAPPR